MGEGQFGIVFKGSFLHRNTGIVTSVAIKTIRPETFGETMQTFLNEIKIMQLVGEHPNIVKILGACVEDVGSGKVFGILELCERGDLKSYLKMCRISPAVKSCLEISSILNGYLPIPEVPLETNYVKL